MVVAVLQRRAVAFLLVTAAVLATDLITTGLKFAIDRPRPYIVEPDPPPLMAATLDLSFPSGHASTSFAAAAMLTWFIPRAAPVLFTLAVLVAASRVYVGVHYPLDVVAGAILGLGVTSILRWLEANRPRSRRSTPAG